MRREATAPDRAFDEVRLLAEAGFSGDARRLASRLLTSRPSDPDAIALAAWTAHRIGAVSEALDGWRRLLEVVEHGDAAMLRLHQLRQEEGEQGAPASDLPLVRRVLRLVAAGQHDRALASCATPAARSADPEQRKLLALIEALLHEMAGRLSAAAAVLTRLGEDPAWAHDLDRLAILARVCERAGDRAGLEAAERVLDFLAGRGQLSAWPRLAELRRSLGDEPGLAEVEARYEEAFRRRMHWLHPADRLAAAALRYVPPAQLAGLGLPKRADAPGEAALLLLLHGDPAGALPLLSETPAWCAEALLTLGETEAALAQAEEAVRCCPDTPSALLLARAVVAAGHLEDCEAGLAAERVLLDAIADPVRLRAAAALARGAGRVEVALSYEARAEAAATRPWPPPGVVRAAAVWGIPGRPKGLVHEVIVRRIGASARERGKLVELEIHGELAKGVRPLLRRIFASVREFVEARFPERAHGLDRWGWGIHLTKEDEPSGGPSLGLPVAIAFASAMLEKQVPRELVFTGAVTCDAAARLAVRPVGAIGTKLKGALHAGARRLVLPAAQRDEALAGTHVPVRFATAAIAPVATFEEALALF